MGLGSLLSVCGALGKVMCSGFIKSDGMSAVLESPTVISSLAKVSKRSEIQNEGATRCVTTHLALVTVFAKGQNKFKMSTV